MKKYIKIDWKGKYLEIYGTCPDKLFSYDIPFQYLSRDGLENWLEHLSGKVWFDKELKADFIKNFNKIKSYVTTKNV